MKVLKRSWRDLDKGMLLNDFVMRTKLFRDEIYFYYKRIVNSFAIKRKLWNVHKNIKRKYFIIINIKFHFIRLVSDW